MWYVVILLAGNPVMYMGTGDTVDSCQQMKQLIAADIESGVKTDSTGTLYVEAENGDRLPWGEWKVVCTQDQPEIEE